MLIMYQKYVYSLKKTILPSQGCDKWQSGGGTPPCFEIKVGRFGKKLAGLGEKLAGLGKKLVG